MIITEDRKYIKDISFDNAEDFLKAISYDGKLYFCIRGIISLECMSLTNTNLKVRKNQIINNI